MACDLTAGRQEVCKESVGGLAGVYFVNFQTGSFTTDVNGLVDGFPASAYTETVNTSRENGTTFFSQELVLNLKKLTNEMTTQLKLMAYGRPQIFVHTMQGDTLLVGEREGADVTAGTIQTGAGLGDLYGYSVTFTGQEQFPASFVSGSTFGEPFGAAGFTNAPTIVYG